MSSIQRHWSNNEGQNTTYCSPFFIMQWNCLADGLAQDGKFDDVDFTNLTWEYRKTLIIHEIRRINPDIFCLQECNRVDTLSIEFKDYFMFWVPKLVSPTLRLGCPPDGCAIFVRMTRYEILHMEPLYYKSNVDRSKLSNQNAVIIHVKDIETVPNRSFLIVSTHLKAKKGYEVERSDQVQQLMNRLNILSSASKSENHDSIPIVLCGDFNDVPDSKMYSEVFKTTNLANLCFNSVYNKCSIETSNSYKPAIHLSDDINFVNEPRFTTWKFRKGVESKYTGDYIFFANPVAHDKISGSTNNGDDNNIISHNHIHLQSIFILPTESEIRSHGLPNTNYPSDHLSLAAEFRWSC